MDTKDNSFQERRIPSMMSTTATTTSTKTTTSNNRNDFQIAKLSYNNSKPPEHDHSAFPFMYGHDKWPYNVEKAFTEALRLIMKSGTSKIKLRNKNYGRNELISLYIRYHTGEVRTKKQISSHIQVWKKSILNKAASSMTLTPLDTEILNLVERGAELDEESLKGFYSFFEVIIDSISKQSLMQNFNQNQQFNQAQKLYPEGYVVDPELTPYTHNIANSMDMNQPRFSYQAQPQYVATVPQVGQVPPEYFIKYAPIDNFHMTQAEHQMNFQPTYYNQNVDMNDRRIPPQMAYTKWVPINQNTGLKDNNMELNQIQYAQYPTPQSRQEIGLQLLMPNHQQQAQQQVQPPLPQSQPQFMTSHQIPHPMQLQRGQENNEHLKLPPVDSNQYFRRGSNAQPSRLHPNVLPKVNYPAMHLQPNHGHNTNNQISPFNTPPNIHANHSIHSVVNPIESQTEGSQLLQKDPSLQDVPLQLDNTHTQPNQDVRSASYLYQQLKQPDISVPAYPYPQQAAQFGRQTTNTDTDAAINK